MKTFVLTLGGAVAVALMFMLLALIAPLVGAFVGAVFAFFFTDTAAVILEFLGLTGRIEFWQLGAALAFIGAFFKTTLTSKTSTKD